MSHLHLVTVDGEECNESIAPNHSTRKKQQESWDREVAHGWNSIDVLHDIALANPKACNEFDLDAMIDQLQRTSNYLKRGRHA